MNKYLLILSLFQPCSSFCQVDRSLFTSEIISENKVKKNSHYVFNDLEKSDSTLISETYYNSSGNPELEYIYDLKTGKTNEVEFKYDNFDNLVSKEVYSAYLINNRLNVETTEEKRTYFLDNKVKEIKKEITLDIEENKFHHSQQFKTIQSSKFKYKNGNLISKEWIESKFETTKFKQKDIYENYSLETFEYDQGLLFKEINFDGLTQKTTEFKYIDGSLVNETNYNQSGQIVSHTNYFYSDNQLAEKILYDNNNGIIRSTMLKYDEKKRIIKKENEYRNGYNIIEFQYSSDSRITKFSSSNNIYFGQIKHSRHYFSIYPDMKELKIIEKLNQMKLPYYIEHFCDDELSIIEKYIIEH